MANVCNIIICNNNNRINVNHLKELYLTKDVDYEYEKHKTNYHYKIKKCNINGNSALFY